MKKHNSVQGTFSRLFGKKHASNNSTSSLFATNPPWIFTQEVNSDSLKTSGEVDGIYYGGNHFASMTDSGTATLKPRPRVRPLLTFLPLDAQETHGVAVPTPSVPESFEDKLPAGSQINGSYRKYNSVIDLRTKAFGEDYLDDDYIPPPPSIPPPSPPPLSVDLPPVSSSVVVPPPPSMVAPPPPPMTPPPPPPMAPPPPPPPALPAPWLSSMAAPSFPYSDVSSPSTPTPPDFIPPPPPPPLPDFMDTAISSIPPISLPVHTQLFSNGVSKWKSETVLNIHNPSLNSPATPIHKELPQLPQSIPDPHLTFPKSLKVPPPTPMRTSSIFSGDKDSSPKKHFPRMTPDSHSPLLPTVQSATIVHSEAEARAKTNTEKHSALVTESKTSDSKICPLKKQQNLSWSTEERTEFSSPGYSSSDDDIWNERCNLDKLKNELSTLLFSTCRKEDRPTEKITFSKSKGTDIDINNVTTDEFKLVKHDVKKTRLSQRAENEKKEKKCANNSPTKSFTKDTFSTADKFPTTQGNCAMKLKEELEALLSPVKEGGPPFAIANLRHNPETRKQVTLQFSGNKVNNGELKFPTAKLEGTEKEPTMPSASVHTCRPPVSSLKSKSEHLAPATSSSSNSETTLPTQTASPSKDLSLQYKTHRSKSDSVDSLVSATSSQATYDGLSSSSINENQRDFTGNMPSTTAKLSRNAEQLSSDVLFHPVTGEKVEKGSPMALLLAAQLRANRGKCSASASQNNSSLLEKPQLKSNNSSQSENGLSTIYYSNSKPNTIKVVPKSPHKDLLAESESKQCNGSSASNNNIRSLSGQSENMPQIFSDATEQCRSTLKFRETNESQSLSSNKCDSPILLQNSNSSHLKQQDPLSRSEIPFHFFPPPQNHTVKNDEVEGFNYEIIPPPPEFSNDTSEIPKLSSDTQISDMQLNFNNSSYNYGNSYSLTSAVQRPSDYSHHYPGDSYTSNYLSSCSNSRPLIKKRLYLSETDDLYSRTAMPARNMSIPNSYGYNSSAVEGIHRANYSHRNNPNSTQGRRVSLEIPGKIITYNTSVNDVQYKSQNGDYSTNAIASGRSCHVSPQYGTLNTFTVRPGTRQPISYSYQGLH
ncbi:uncharacterized protein C6orf132 homolog [Protobothrops mucrosquamatus]|uniref:uncharacterized protein C6orf132 homolog n=1 Tax=Protobothrops mucrosquamatus TaxID=103944 RepID=UPI000775FB63|nr:uncharacterized protein C6orf132 homolog [Protobothrops mucrosquamatus]